MWTQFNSVLLFDLNRSEDGAVVEGKAEGKAEGEASRVYEDGESDREEDDDEEDADEDCKDDEDDDDDKDYEDVETVIFQRRCTLSTLSSEEPDGPSAWCLQGLGNLKIVYDDEMLCARIVFEADGVHDQLLCDNVIAIETVLTVGPHSRN